MVKQGQAGVSQELESPISRRRFIQGVITASTVTGAGALSSQAEAGALTTSTLASDHSMTGGEGEGAFKILTPEQGLLLVAVLNRIIPAHESMPGAGDVGIANYVDEVLVDAPHLRRHVIGLLVEIQAQGVFARLSGVERDQLLQRMAKNQKESFEVLLQITYTGYYSQPQVLEAVGWAPSPESAGQSERFTERLLDTVRKRGPIYREV